MINLVLNLALIPPFGMRGAAIATSIGYGSMFVFHCWSARLVGFDPLADARLSRAALTTLLAAVPIVALSTAITNPWIALAVVPPVGFGIFIMFALLVGAIDIAEPFEILSLFPDPIGAKADGITTRLVNSETDGSGVTGCRVCCSSLDCRCYSRGSRSGSLIPECDSLLAGNGGEATLPHAVGRSPTTARRPRMENTSQSSSPDPSVPTGCTRPSVW